ncbi:MAG TPA: YciI family protein [Sphingomicrobium sp.]|nr:YciI family protein [Sphingomicrobium sp.]
MQYLVAGILRPGTEEQLLRLHDEFNDHLGQSAHKITMFGLLRSKDGKRSGYIAFIEANSFDAAEAFLKESPFYQNDLYERVEVAEFTPEVGDFK